MVISDHGRDTIDFGGVVNGMSHLYSTHLLTKYLRRISDKDSNTIKNIRPEKLHVS